MDGNQLKAIKLCPFTATSTLILARKQDGNTALYLNENKEIKPFNQLGDVDILDFELSN
jgi:hypothetical protein